MNRKRISLVSFFVLCAMLVPSSRSVQAQTVTPGNIVKWFDAAGTPTDSVISENNVGNIGIGDVADPNPGLLLRLASFQMGASVLALVENTGPFSAAGIRLKTQAPGNSWTIFAGDTSGGTADGLFFDNTGLRDKFTVKATSGNVGIGTPSPTAKLHVVGDFIATGTKTALVETASYGKRQLYAMESAENWFEDFGGAKLINGQAVVQLDPIFAETVNTESEYHVFLTPRGDCNGLYVVNQTPISFEVRELQNGKGTIAFHYRIVAKRKGYERARLTKVEEEQREAEIVHKVPLH